MFYYGVWGSPKVALIMGLDKLLYLLVECA
jgi:hypothetical protein